MGTFLNVLLFVTLPFMLHKAGGTGHLKFITQPGDYNFLEAQRICSLRHGNWTLPVAHRHTQYSSLASYMEKAGVASAWTGLKLFTFKDWTWTDGATYERWRVFNKSLTCGAISKEGTLKRVSCKRKGVGFICEIPGEKYCPLQNCFPYQDVQLMISCYARDWYAERQFCRKLGGDLPVFKSTAKTNFVLQILNSSMRCSYSDTSVFFIGLHNQDWLSEEDVVRLDKEAKLADKSRQPNLCAAVTYQKHTNLFSVARRCLDQAGVICQSGFSLSSSHIYTNNEKNGCLKLERSLRSDILLIWLAVIMTAFLLFFLLKCMVWLWKKRRKRTDHRNITPLLHSSVEDFTISLL